MIAASLRNGLEIIGQCEISHPGSAVGAEASIARRVSLSGHRPAHGQRGVGVAGSPTLVAAASSLSAVGAEGEEESLPYMNLLLGEQCIEKIGVQESDVNVREQKQNHLQHASARHKSPPRVNLLEQRIIKQHPTPTTPSSTSALPPPSPHTITTTSTTTTPTTTKNLIFSKSATPPLPSPIRRIYYVDPTTGYENLPLVNPLLPSYLDDEGRSVLYAVGSLYTSIVPCLIVPGVGRRIAQGWEEDKKMDEDDAEQGVHSGAGGRRVRRAKILILNGTTDRETFGYSAMDFVLAVTDALNYSCRAEGLIKRYQEELESARNEDKSGVVREPESEERGRDPQPSYVKLQQQQ
ncbi:hypothetical protein HK102_007039, partial [Quaeritorhiza haematococci]